MRGVLGVGSPLHTTFTLAYTVCVLHVSCLLFFILFLETAKDQAMMMAKYLSISNQYLLISNLLYTVLLFLNHALFVSSVES